MKRLLQFWCKGKMDVRIPPAMLRNANKYIHKIRKFIPTEFCRKPRSLSDVDRFKATEFRLFLLYTGPLILRSILNIDMYKHFLYLSCAIRILATPHLCIDLNDFANELLIDFVKKYGHLYGPDFVTYNVHNLLHLSKDVLKFGNLDKFSAFKFENYMYQLKNKICLASGKPLQQIAKRLAAFCDTSVYEKPQKIPFVISHKNKVVLDFQNFSLTNIVPDNCCLLKNNNFILINKIHGKEGNQIEGIKLQSKGSLFTVPLDSRCLGIHLLMKSEECISVSHSNVLCKIVLLSWENLFVSFPLIHSSGNKHELSTLVLYFSYIV